MKLKYFTNNHFTCCSKENNSNFTQLVNNQLSKYRSDYKILTEVWIPAMHGKIDIIIFNLISIQTIHGIHLWSVHIIQGVLSCLRLSKYQK